MCAEVACSQKRQPTRLKCKRTPCACSTFICPKKLSADARQEQEHECFSAGFFLHYLFLICTEKISVSIRKFGENKFKKKKQLLDTQMWRKTFNLYIVLLCVTVSNFSLSRIFDQPTLVISLSVRRICLLHPFVLGVVCVIFSHNSCQSHCFVFIFVFCFLPPFIATFCFPTLLVIIFHWLCWTKERNRCVKSAVWHRKQQRACPNP